MIGDRNMTPVFRFEITFILPTMAMQLTQYFRVWQDHYGFFEVDVFELAYGLASSQSKHVASPYKKRTQNRIHGTIRSPSISD